MLWVLLKYPWQQVSFVFSRFGVEACSDDTGDPQVGGAGRSWRVPELTGDGPCAAPHLMVAKRVHRCLWISID
jgi:hypothetical protein